MFYLKLILLLCLCSFALSADILIMSPVSSISHSRWFGKLALLLYNNGHKVTVLDKDKWFFQHPNITTILMEGGYQWMGHMDERVKEEPDALEPFLEMHGVLGNIVFLADPAALGCEPTLRSKGFRNFLDQYKGKTFDLIIGDGFCECFYGVVPYFGNPPLIPASPFSDILASEFVGLADNPSYVPFHLSEFNSTMSLTERITNIFYYLMNSYLLTYLYVPNNNALMKEVFGPSVPKLEDILKRVPIVMTGNNFAFDGAKPLPPNYIPVGGLHVDPPKPLPQDIKSFLDGAKDGAVLFSMGSNFKSTLMSEEKREMFLSVFRNIPQRVIWKLEVDGPVNAPPNVLILKWLPQSDILAHPNVKAFISHGGLLGTHEAIVRGVPVLGLPLMADQIKNLRRLEKHGAGIRLFYRKLSKEYIAQELDTILNDPSYLKNMKRLSEAFSDLPQTPQERALFWIEYVLRNSNKPINFLRPASLDLAWYQVLLLDVAVIFFLLIAVVYFTIKSVLRFIFNLFSQDKGGKSKNLIKSKVN